MGRKAKLKKQRHQIQQNQSDFHKENSANPQNFMQQMAKQGYHLAQIERSPEVPQDKIEPQV